MTGAPTTEHFPTDTAGLPAGVDSEAVEVSDGDVFELGIAPVTKQLGDATVRMLAYNGSIPGPTLRVREGSEIVVNVANEGRPGGDGALARAAARQPLRRHARDAGADPGRRHVHLPDRVPRPGRLLVPPAHPRGLRPGDGPVREHPRRPRRSRLLAARPPRAAADARRRPDRGRQDRALRPRRRRPTRRWAGSAT